MHGHHRAGASVAAVLAAAALSLAVASPTQAALPPGFADDPVVTGLSVPRDLAFLPSGDILVIENEGLVKVVESGAARELLDLRAAVRVSGEQGLLGVAVDPDFPGRPYAYFHYTADETPGHVRLSRFTFLNASGPGPLGIDPSSELVFLGDIPDDAFNHNGGTVRFGPDKRLYMSIGEDADPCDAQNLSLLKGKILRVNVNASADPATRSTLVPADNPFSNHSDPNAALVYALGLRNPFRLDIDPATGVLYIGDVGQSQWEEVDVSLGGENFGWPYFEGFNQLRSRSSNPCPGDSGGGSLTPPIHVYPNPGGAAIILDGVYRGVDYPNDSSFPPAFEGAVFFHDFYGGNLRALAFNASAGEWSLVPGVSATNWSTGLSGIPSMRVGPDGALHYVNAYTGHLRRIAHTAAPSIVSPTVLPAGTVNATYAFGFEATGGRMPYAWSITTGSPPPGLSLNATNGVLEGTPTSTGAFTFAVRVVDSLGVFANQSVSITIRDHLRLLAFGPYPAFEDEPFDLALSASGGLRPYLWTIASGDLPSGVTLQPSTGVITGSPNTAGPFNFTVQVADPEGRTAALSFTGMVTAALRIATTALPDAEVFVEYSASVAASGGVPPYTWALEAGALPAGLNFTASGTITGVPFESGLFPLTVSVADTRSRLAYTTLDLAVAPPAGAPPLISVSFAPEAIEGEAYEWTLTAVGGYPPFVWSVVEGELPPGVALAANGSVSGTASQAGNFTFTVGVVDSFNLTANATFTISVRPLPHSLTLLPVGNVFALAGAPMTAVQVHWTGENVVQPLAWAAEGLPAGLAIDEAGNITGEPSAIGRFSVRVSAVDSAAEPATANVTFTIEIPRVDVVARALPTFEVGVAALEPLVLPDASYSLTFSVAAGELPPGLVLTEAGALTGTPTEAGNRTFTLRASGPGPADNYEDVVFTAVVIPSTAPPDGQPPRGGLALEAILVVVILVAVVAYILSRRQLRR